MQSIRVEPAKLVETAAKIESQSAEYKKLYEQLYTEVDSMANAYQGADNVAFTTQINGFKEDLFAMYKLMTQYAEFLKDTAGKYQNAQEMLTTQAKKLQN